jgi:hypothetical protein
VIGIVTENNRAERRNEDLERFAFRAVIKSVYGFILRRGATVELRPAFMVFEN